MGFKTPLIDVMVRVLNCGKSSIQQGCMRDQRPNAGAGDIHQRHASLPIPFVDLVHQWWDVWWKHLDMYPDLECDVTSISFSIAMPNSRVYLFNLHERMEQMWLSSPISGGHHFVYHPTTRQSCDESVGQAIAWPKPFGQWLDTRTNQRLQAIVMQEWQDHYAITIPWLG